MAVHQRMLGASQLASAPASHQIATPRSAIRQGIGKIIFSIALLASATALIAPQATAQDLGEIARQERAKKQSNPAPPATHVYTNEDMQRQQILTPEDQSRFSATTQPAAIKPAPSATQLVSESTLGNADRPIGARPPILTISNTPNATSSPTRNPVHQCAAQKTIQLPAQKNISSASVMRAKTNATPTTRANISATPATGANSLPTPPSQPAPKPIPAAAAQIPVVQTFAEINIDGAPTPAPGPLDQMPLGDVARYYRAQKHQFARANPQSDPGLFNAPYAPTLATTIPNEIPLGQMPLGDVARYYRTKKREEDAAIASAAASTPESNPVPPFSAAPVQTAKDQSATSRPSKVSNGKYPLALATMPLASMKPSTPSPDLPPPAHARSTRTSPIAHPNNAIRQPASIRILRGDTLWQLARRYLGSGARWQELAPLNPTIQNPRRLQIGAQLVLHPSTT